MTADEAIAIVKSKAAGRTRVVGIKSEYLDEVLVAEIERLRKRLSDAESTLSLVEAICPPDTGSDWWCPKCKDVLSGSHVTFTEHCDTCGTYLGDCQPDDKWQALRERLSVAHAAREGDK